MPNNAVLKTLWLLRFEKMRQNEEAAAWIYQEILDECLSAFGPEDEVVLKLKQLVQEERMHEKLAGQLLEICRQNHPELGLL